MNVSSTLKLSRPLVLFFLVGFFTGGIDARVSFIPYGSATGESQNFVSREALSFSGITRFVGRRAFNAKGPVLFLNRHLENVTIPRQFTMKEGESFFVPISDPKRLI